MRSHIVDDAVGGPYHSIIVVDAAGHRNVFYDPAHYRVVTEDDLPDALIQSAKVFLLDHITEPSLAAVAEKVRRLGVPILSDIEEPTSSAAQLAQLADYLIVPQSVRGLGQRRTRCARCLRISRAHATARDHRHRRSRRLLRVRSRRSRRPSLFRLPGASLRHHGLR